MASSGDYFFIYFLLTCLLLLVCLFVDFFRGVCGGFNFICLLTFFLLFCFEGNVKWKCVLFYISLFFICQFCFCLLDVFCCRFCWGYFKCLISLFYLFLLVFICFFFSVLSPYLLSFLPSLFFFCVWSISSALVSCDKHPRFQVYFGDKKQCCYCYYLIKIITVVFICFYYDCY